MATLAADTILSERWIRVPVLRPVNRTHLTRMAIQATGLDRPVPARYIITLVTWRYVPLCLLRIPGYGCLKEKAVESVQVASPCGSGSNEVLDAMLLAGVLDQ